MQHEQSFRQLSKAKTVLSLHHLLTRLGQKKHWKPIIKKTNKMKASVCHFSRTWKIKCLQYSVDFPVCNGLNCRFFSCNNHSYANSTFQSMEYSRRLLLVVEELLYTVYTVPYISKIPSVGKICRHTDI
jgi:hypothetical protein